MNALMLELIPLIREGYCCSQLLVLLVLQQQGVENPGLVRAAGGLCHGMGQSGGACGLLTGGAAALGYLACKGAAGETAHPMAEPLINDYAACLPSMYAPEDAGMFPAHRFRKKRAAALT